MFSDLLIRLRALFRRDTVESELDEELRFHVDNQIEKLVRRGMSLPEATRRARLIIGTPDKIKEECRDACGTRWLEDLWQDVRYAVRNLAKNPGFTAVALLSLTLGIGGNTTIFTLVKAVFLQSIPVKDPSTAVVVYSTRQTADGKILHFGKSSYPNAKDFREKNDVFSGMSVFVDTGDSLAVPGSTKPIFVDVQLVNWDFFDILGVRPAIGRTFAADDDQGSEAHPVAILNYEIWNTKFGADPNILNKTVHLNEQDFSVIGVMPKEFQRIGEIGNPSVWAPIEMHDRLAMIEIKDWFPRRRSAVGNMVARLKPNVSLRQARASMNSLGNRLAEEYPADNSGRNVELVPLSETIIWPDRRGVYVLVAALMMGIVGLVLLIACGNVANLLLARGIQRRHEFAVRLSLGASRWRLIRQLLTESLLMGLTAGGLAVVFAYWARNLVWLALPFGRPAVYDFSLDGRVLFFTLGISILATLLFGLFPALQASEPQQVSVLREQAEPASGSSRWYGLRGILVMAQTAFSVIALVGSALFIHSLRNAQRVDPGFETKDELMVTLNPGNQHYSQARAEEYYRDATKKVRALPMVASAGIGNYPVFILSLTSATFPEGVDTSDLRNSSQFPVMAVSPGYFSTLGIPILKGRDVDEHDDAQSNYVVVINQALADYWWPGKNPIGQHLTLGARSHEAEVVGVVRTVKTQTLGESPKPLLYFPLKQFYFPNAVLYVRTKGDPDAAIPSIRNAVRSIDPAMQFGVFPVAQQMSGQLSAPRIAAKLLSGFALLALMLAAIGTCGVMSYSVSQRTQEIGIRMPLGAQRGDVLRLILQNGMAMVIAGVVVGLGVSVIFTRSINSLLYGIGSFDTASFFVAAVVLIAVALVACLLPARRAMRVDPIVALRYE